MTTTETAPLPIRKRIPWGLLGMLVMISAAEMCVARHDLDLTSQVALDWKSAGARARRQAPKCEILCFGDSLIKLGVSPRIIEDVTGKRCYNLALLYGVAPADYFLLRRALEGGARPSAVLLELLPTQLHADYHASAQVLALREMLDARECLDLARTKRDASLFAELMVGRYLPSVRKRDEIRNRVMEGFRGHDASALRSNLSVQRNWVANRGGQIMQRNPNFRMSTANPAQWRNLIDPWTPRPENVAYLRRFLRLAEQNKVQVYWLIPPFPPEVQARRREAGQDDVFGRFVQAFQAQFPNLTVLDARRSSYPETVFIDAIHLDKQGSSTLSADVAAVLRDRSADGNRGGRWVDLPSYREPTIKVPLEDVEQSTLALDAAGKRRL